MPALIVCLYAGGVAVTSYICYHWYRCIRPVGYRNPTMPVGYWEDATIVKSEGWKIKYTEYVNRTQVVNYYWCWFKVWLLLYRLRQKAWLKMTTEDVRVTESWTGCVQFPANLLQDSSAQQCLSAANERASLRKRLEQNLQAEFVSRQSP